MKWSKEKPLIEGTYWIKEYENDKPSTCEIEFIGDFTAIWKIGYDDYQVWHPNSYWFLGPIEP